MSLDVELYKCKKSFTIHESLITKHQLVYIQNRVDGWEINLKLFKGNGEYVGTVNQETIEKLKTEYLEKSHAR